MRTLAALAAVALLAPTIGCQSSSNTPEATPASSAATATPQAEADPTRTVAGQGLPAGWQSRFDRANASATDVQFAPMDGGFHVTSGPAAIYWNPSTQASGSFTIATTAHQLKQAAHPEAYGLFFGGRSLEGPEQRYTYFLVRQDGSYTVRHRAGTEVHTIAAWTAHPAVKKTDANGRATNALAVTATADSVRFLVNGTQVAAYPRASVMDVDGQVGYRVNHNLDVHLEPITVTRQ